MTAPARVLVLGGDALDDVLVRDWAAAGVLPTFRRLLAEGLWATSVNPVGLYVGALWPSFMTGVSPQRHGRYCHHQIAPGSYQARLFRVGDLRREPFWATLSRAGRRVGVIDVPKAPLVPDLAGMQLADWGTHDPDPGAVFATSPPELAAEVAARFGTDPVGPCDRVPRTPEGLRALRDHLLARIATKGRLAAHYLAQGGWDLFLTVFNDPQCAGHQFWHLHDPTHPRHDPALARALGDPMRDAYVAIDAAIGHILQTAGRETTVVVYGSHGMGPHYGGSFLLDEILQRLESARLPFAGVRQQVAAAGQWLWRHTPLRLGKLPAPLAQRMRAGLGASLPTLDLPGTRRCFQVPNNDVWGAIRVNVVGREPTGRVRRGVEYDRFCDELAGDLRALVDPETGRAVVRRVIRTDDVYPRAPADDLPDVLVEWHHDHPIVAVTSPRTGTIRGTYRGPRTGDHRPDGFVLVRAAGVPAGPLGRALAVTDLAPTIAALLGVTLPDVDGVPAEELLAAARGAEPATAAPAS